MNRARLSSLELPPALFFVLFMALLTGLAVPPRVCAENSYPGWAYPNRVDCTSWPTFDEFHKMSVEEKQQVELAWMMKVYESDPKWESNYRFNWNLFMSENDGLSDIPGWIRDAWWSTTTGSVWGSCSETAGQSETDCQMAQKTFLDQYYPPQPPADATYVPPNYGQLVRAPFEQLNWSVTNSPQYVSFLGIEPAWATHQLVKVAPKGAENDANQSYAFDPWGTGYPEVLTWNEAHNRSYTYSGSPKVRAPSVWEAPRPNSNDCPDAGGGSGLNDPEGGDDTGASDPTDSNGAAAQTPVPPEDAGGDDTGAGPGPGPTATPKPGGGGSGGNDPLQHKPSSPKNYLPKPVTAPPVAGDNPDDNIDAGRSRSAVETGHFPLLRTAYIRLARKAGLNAIADRWAGADSRVFQIGAASEPEAYFHPLRFYFLDYAATALPERIGADLQAQIREIRQIPEIAVFAQGYYSELAQSLSAQGIPCAVLGQPDVLARLGEYKVLVIPSGALGGIGRSAIFRQALESFARSGGSILVLAQPRGEDFLCLPGSEGLRAHGWQEDQSCFSSSVVISDFHPALASQASFSPSLHIDGFFSQWTGAMKPALIRKRNPVPVILTWNYGAGVVAVSSTYPDWAATNGIASEAETRLLRDMCLWGLHARAEMVYGAPGASVQVPVKVFNSGAQAASAVRFQVVDAAGRAVGNPIAQAAVIDPQTTFTTTLALVAPAEAGIYEIDAELDTPAGTVRAFSVGVFASANRFPAVQGTTNGQGISAAIVTQGDLLNNGDPVEMEIQLFNENSEPATVDFTLNVPFTDAISRTGIVVPASGSIFIPLTAMPSYFGWRSMLSLAVFEGGTRHQIAAAQRVIHYVRKYATICIFSSATERIEGERLDIHVEISKGYSNSEEDAWLFSLQILDPAGKAVVEEFFGDAPQPSYITYDTSYIVPQSAAPGAWTILCRGSFGTITAGGQSAFAVKEPFAVALSPKNGRWYGQSMNPIVLTGRVRSLAAAGFEGTLRLSVPAAGFDQSIPVTIGGRASQTHDFSVALPALAAGEYAATLRAERSGQPLVVEKTAQFSIPPAEIEASLNAAQVNAGGVVQFNIANIGGEVVSDLRCDFRLVQGAIVGTTGTAQVALAPNETRSLSCPVPADLAPGRYQFEVTSTASGHAPWFKSMSAHLHASEAVVAASTSRYAYTTSDPIGLTANYAYQGASLPGASMRLDVLEDTLAQTFGQREGMRSDAMHLAWSADGKVAVMGSQMGVKIYNASTHRYLAGLGDIWQNETRIRSGDIAFDNTSRLLVLNGDTKRVERYEVSSPAVHLGGWAVRDQGPLAALALASASDGRIYIARGMGDTGTADSFIEVYSAEGVFERQFGSFGSGDGQFIQPTHVEVDSEGNVYVCDASNRRAYRFGPDGALAATYLCDGKTPAGIVRNGNSIYVLSESDYSGPDSESIYVFDLAGVNTSKISIYSTKNRDLVLTRGTGGSTFAVLEALSIYGADVRMLNAQGILLDTITGMRNISGMAVLPSGLAVASDTSAGVIWGYSEQNGFYEFATAKSLGKSFFMPSDVAANSAGTRVYVSDQSSARNIFILDAQGNKIGSLPAGGGAFTNAPAKLFVDAGNLLHVWFEAENRVTTFDLDGNFVRSVVLNDPPVSSHDMAVDPSGNIWMAQTGSLLEYSSGGALLRQFDDYRAIWAIDIDADGAVYLGSLVNSVIYVLNPGGSLRQTYKEDNPIYFTALDATRGRIYFARASQRGFGYFGSLWFTETVALPGSSSTGIADGTAPPITRPCRGLFVATLLNQYGQALGSGSAPFLVSDDAIRLGVSTDRRVYAQGDVATIRMTAENRSGAPAQGDLALNSSAGAVLWTQSLNLADGEVFDFSLPHIAGAASEDLTLSFNGYSARGPLRVAAPAVELTANVPAQVTRDPFDVAVTLNNTSDVDATGILVVKTASSERWAAVSIAARSKGIWTLPAWIENNDTVRVELSGDVGASRVYSVQIGPQIAIQPAPDGLLAPGEIRVPYRIENTGSLGAIVPVTFAAGGQTVSVSHRVEAGAAVLSELLFTLDIGTYELSYESPYASGAAILRVGTMDFALAGAPVVTVLPDGGKKSDQAEFSAALDGAIVELIAGNIIQVAVVAENHSPIAGSAELTLRLPGIFDEARSIFIESVASQAAVFETQIPADLPDGEYPIEILLNGRRYAYSYRVTGPKVLMTASLDRGAYLPGETARLTVQVTNQSTRPLHDLAVQADYNGESQTQNRNLPPGATASLPFDFTAAQSGAVAAQVVSSDGRSFVIDSIRLNVTQGVRVSLDKEAYKPFETALVTVQADQPTTILLEVFDKSASLVFASAGTTQWSFWVPEAARSTCYLVYNAQFAPGAPQAALNGAAYFDVDGPEIVVTRETLTPPVPADVCTIGLALEMRPHSLTSAEFEFTATDESSCVLGQWRQTVQGLASDTPTSITFRRRIAFRQSGLHAITYQAFSGSAGARVASGRVLFDAVSSLAPAVVSAAPENGASKVPIGCGLTVRFSRPMNAESVRQAFRIEPATDLEFTWPLDTLMVARPRGRNLLPATQYTCQLSAAALDAEGQTLEQPIEWTFTTRAQPSAGRFLGLH